MEDLTFEIKVVLQEPDGTSDNKLRDAGEAP